MKHINSLFLVFLTFAACSQSTTESKTVKAENKTKEVVEKEFSVKTIEHKDSVYIDKNENGDSVWVHTNYTCTYPVTNKPEWQKAKQNILFWICDIFADSTHTNWNDIEQAMKRQSDDLLAEKKKYFSPELPDEKCYIQNVYLERSINIERIFENDTLVTVGVGIYEFWDGAHGGYYYEGRTFNKKTGHQYGFDLLSKYDKKTLNSLFRKGLQDYFECSDDELSTFLWSDEIDVNDIPLPSTSPYITEKGIIVTYQQYEIACFAAGMPSFVIPLK